MDHPLAMGAEAMRRAGDDLAWLTGTQPAGKARTAASLAERLQNR